MRVMMWIGAVFAALLISAAPASAGHVQCGDVIIENTTLDSDLIDCAGSGIVVGSPGVTLDLGGHTIDGAGESLPEPIGVSAGSFPAGISGVVIQNGSIRDFPFGVVLDFARNSAVRNVSFAGGHTGILSTGGRANRLEANRMFGMSVEVSDHTGTVIDRNRLAGRGIEITGGSNSVMTRNWVFGSIRGIRISEAADTTVLRNTLAGNGVGIWAVNSAYRTRVERNFAYGNIGDGIQVECCESLVLRNVATANGDDGIHVASNGTDEFGPDRVAGNTANYNADLGIEAVGVVDDGHNKARGNGNPAQCVGVRCK